MLRPQPSRLHQQCQRKQQQLRRELHVVACRSSFQVRLVRQHNCRCLLCTPPPRGSRCRRCSCHRFCCSMLTPYQHLLRSCQQQRGLGGCLSRQQDPHHQQQGMIALGALCVRSPVQLSLLLAGACGSCQMAAAAAYSAVGSQALAGVCTLWPRLGTPCRPPQQQQSGRCSEARTVAWDPYTMPSAAQRGICTACLG